MTLPTLLLGAILATLYGALYHLVRNGGFRRLLLFIVLAWIGFITGQVAGAALNFTWFEIGALLTGSASLGSLVFLVVGDWLLKPV